VDLPATCEASHFNAGAGEGFSIRDSLIAERIKLTDDDERRRQAGESSRNL
jgi:hypothetical protein